MELNWIKLAFYLLLSDKNVLSRFKIGFSVQTWISYLTPQSDLFFSVLIFWILPTLYKVLETSCKFTVWAPQSCTFRAMVLDNLSFFFKQRSQKFPVKLTLELEHFCFSLWITGQFTYWLWTMSWATGSKLLVASASDSAVAALSAGLLDFLRLEFPFYSYWIVDSFDLVNKGSAFH